MPSIIGNGEKNDCTLDHLIEKHPTGKVVNSKQILPEDTAWKPLLILSSKKLPSLLREALQGAPHTALKTSEKNFQMLRPTGGSKLPPIVHISG